MSIRLEHVYKKYRFKDEFAISDASFEIKDREIVVVTGPSNSGKSSLIRMIKGLEDISEGKIFIDERCVNYIAPKDRDIAYIGSSFGLYPKLNVLDNLLFGLRRKVLANNEKISSWFGSPNSRGQELIDRACTLAAIFDLTDKLKVKPRKLHGHDRERVALGRLLLKEPRAFLMDSIVQFQSDLKLKIEYYHLIITAHKELNLATSLIFVVNIEELADIATFDHTIIELKDGVIQGSSSLK